VSLVHAAPVTLIAATFASWTLVLLIVAGVLGVALGHTLRTWRYKKLQQKKAAAAKKPSGAQAAPKRTGGSKSASARTASKKSRPRTPPPGKTKKS
jgi:hypothetical protein